MLLGIFNFFAMIPSCISENSRQGLPPVFEELHPVFEPVFPPTDAGFAASFPKTCGRVTFLPEDWRRITRTTDGQTFVSIYDGNDESHEYLLENSKDRDDKDGRGERGDRDEHGNKCPSSNDHKPSLNLVREFIGGPGTDDLEATKYHGRSLNLLKDALGSTIALTNRGGNPVAKMGYDAWGNLRFPDKPGYVTPPCGERDLDDYLDRCDGGRAFENSGLNPFHLGRHHGNALTPYLYTGRRLDGFSQFYNNRNRMYNPAVGRFVSRDPIGFGGGNNLWSYAGNGPLNRVDPFGQSSILLYDDANEGTQSLGLETRWRLHLRDFDVWIFTTKELTPTHSIDKILDQAVWMGPLHYFVYIGEGAPGALVPSSVNWPWVPCPPALPFNYFEPGNGWAIFHACHTGEPGGVAFMFADAYKVRSTGVLGYAFAFNGQVVEPIVGSDPGYGNVTSFPSIFIWALSGNRKKTYLP